MPEAPEKPAPPKPKAKAKKRRKRRLICKRCKEPVRNERGLSIHMGLKHRRKSRKPNQSNGHFKVCSTCEGKAADWMVKHNRRKLSVTVEMDVAQKTA